MSSVKMITVACALITFAAMAAIAENGHASGPTPARVENRKAAMLKRIDERIARLQDERASLQAAATAEDMKACREKFQRFRRQGGPNPRRANSLA